MAARRTTRVASTAEDSSPLPLDPATWTAVAAALALSPQQTRIVELILQGRHDKEIAAELGLTVPTVRTYLTRIFTRANVSDRLSLVLRVFAVAQELRTGPGRHQSR